MLIVILLAIVFCSKCGLNTYNFEIIIHADPEAIMALNSAVAKNLYSETQPNVTITVFIGAIFDKMNKDLKEHGIQLQANFNRLNFVFYKPKYNTDICGGSAAAERASVILSLIRKREKTDDIGNRLVLNFCQNFVHGTSYGHVLSAGSCGHVSSVIFGEVHSLMDTIESTVYQMIGNAPNYLDQQGVNSRLVSNMCNYGIRCLNPFLKTSIGKVLTGSQMIEHNPEEEKYLNPEDQIFEQDLYLEDRQPAPDRFLDGFAAVDYSNDSELFEDVEKSKMSLPF